MASQSNPGSASVETDRDDGAAATARGPARRESSLAIAILAGATAFSFGVVAAAGGWLLVEARQQRAHLAAEIEKNRDEFNAAQVTTVRDLARINTLLEQRFTEFNTHLDKRFTEFDAGLDTRLSGINMRIAGLHTPPPYTWSSYPPGSGLLSIDPDSIRDLLSPGPSMMLLPGPENSAAPPDADVP